jgi:hypothetical protein
MDLWQGVDCFCHRHVTVWYTAVVLVLDCVVHTLVPTCRCAHEYQNNMDYMYVWHALKSCILL